MAAALRPESASKGGGLSCSASSPTDDRTSSSSFRSFTHLPWKTLPCISRSAVRISPAFPRGLDLTIRDLPHKVRLILIVVIRTIRSIARPDRDSDRVALGRNIGVVQIIELVG